MRHFHFTKNSLALLTAAVLPLGAVACGDDDDGDIFPIEDFIYKGSFKSLNNSGVTGSVELARDVEDDLFVVTVDAEGLSGSMVHPQHVHAASACPDASADTNSDGFVDVAEGVPAYGGILIPLDSMLAEQVPGDFPTATGNGEIDYRAETVLSTMVENLKAADPQMPLVGLNGELTIDARTVVLHGTGTSTLPDTVASFGSAPATLTLPVACATLELDSTSRF